MADYNIKADITANTKGYEAGIKKAQESTKKFSTSLSKVIQGLGKNGLVGAMGSIGLASAGLSATLGAVVKIAKQVSQTIGECTEAYKQQLIAERQLETAINNNPLVTGSAKKRLTEFANEMQKVSNYGDEQLIPMMANLVSLGRTEEETMKIMAVAMDMSASGSMSLDTAITQLNATLNGNIGRLGQQNAELKGLTDEELKSGKAIDILGEKFKGLSQATLDTSKQLKNIKGDFKEAIGEFTLPSSDMWNKFWIGFYDKGISVIKQFDEYMDKTIIGKGIAEELIKGYKSITDERQKVLYLEDNIHALSETQIVALQKHLESTKNRNKEQEELLRKVKMEVEARKYLATVYAEMDAEEAERQKTEEEQLAIENEIAILKGKYLEKMAEQERKWKNIKDVTGEEVKTEEKIKFYQDSLVDLMTKAGGQITTNNQLYKDQIKIIQKLQAELNPEEKETSYTWAKKIREQSISRLEAEKQAELERLESRQATEVEIFNVTSYYNDKLRELNRQKIEEERQQALKSVEDYANAQEEKARINQYYDNQLLDNNLKFIVDLKSQNAQIPNGFAEGFKKVIASAKEMSKKIIKVFSDISKTVKSIFSNGKGILSKLFEFNPDEALDKLLVFEDKVLTFFVETLPKLPQFFASAFQSIGVLLQNVMNSGGLNIIGQIVSNIIETAINNIPSIVKMIGQLIIKIVNNLVPILDGVVPVLFDVVVSLVESLMKKLPQLIKVVVEFLSTMIQRIVKVLPSLIKAILPNLLKAILQLVKSLLKEMPKIIKVIIDALPEIITTVIRSLVEFFGNLKGSDIALFIKGIVQMVSQIANALIQNITQLVAELIPVMIQIIVELIKSIPDILKGLAEGVWDGIKWVGEKVWDGIKNIGSGLKDIGSKIKKGFMKLLGFATGTNNAPKGLALVGEAGPELVRFRGGEQVLNNRNTQKLLATSGNAGNTFNVTFNNLQDTSAYAMMSQLRQYNRQLSINGVI